VVWCNSNLRLIYYSFYDGVRWVPAKALNDTAQIGAPAWADPHIAIDRTGVLHVSFTGVARGATGRDIFYTRNEGRGWTPPVRVTQDTIYNYNEWYSDIAADRPDNVWVVWSRQDEGLGFQIYAAHYDGEEWSAEQRVDNDTTYGIPAVCLNQAGYPWVVWDGYIPTPGEPWIFCNRYSPVPVSESFTSTGRGELALSVPSPVNGLLRLRYLVPSPMLANITVFDPAGRRVLKTAIHRDRAGWETIELNQPLASGVYLCQLNGAGYVVTKKFVVTGR
jgi:hypothetical protein